LDIVVETIVHQKLNVINEGSNFRILKLAYWVLTSKKFSPSFHEIYEIITIKDQSFFWDYFS
jgi:hypothetical protein